MKPSPAQAHPSRSLLVVEDDKASRDLLGLMIATKFPEVTIHYAEDGRAGLELFKRHTPFVVITDVNLPEMDGIQMATEIRVLKADTKLIVITAYSDRDYLEKFNRIGFDAYILKPIVFSKLFNAVEDCFAEAGMEPH